MIRQWIEVDADVKTSLLALADAKASVLNSLFRPDYRPEPKPCVSDEDMMRERYALGAG